MDAKLEGVNTSQALPHSSILSDTAPDVTPGKNHVGLVRVVIGFMLVVSS